MLYQKQCCPHVYQLLPKSSSLFAPKIPTPAVSVSHCSYPTTKHVLHGAYNPVFGNSRYPPSKDKVTYLSGCCVHGGIDSSRVW